MSSTIFKVVLFGDAGCGKTTLAKRFMTDAFIPDRHMTIGVDFEYKSLTVDNKCVKLMTHEQLVDLYESFNGGTYDDGSFNDWIADFI